MKYFIVSLLLRKEEKEMAIVYATLIVKGKKTFDQVPPRLQDQVREVLIDLEAPEDLYV